MRLKPSFPRLRQGHPLASGLAGAWLMEEGSGHVLKDLSSKGNDGTIILDPAWVPGPHGPAIQFTAAANRVELPGIIGASPDFTQSLWARLDNTLSGVLFGEGRSSTNTPTVFFQANENATNKLKVFWRNDANVAYQAVDTSTVANDGEWHYWVATKNSGTLTLYRDGVQIAQTSGLSGAITLNRRTIGALGRSTYALNVDAKIADVRVYERALSPSEVEESYADPFAMFRPRQRSYFAFTEVAGTTYTLTCDTGSFTLTGIDANLNANRLLTADVGSFELTGIDAGLIASRKLTAGVGEFTLTGQDAGLLAGRLLDADVGSFALTGIDANLLANRLLDADVGAFALTGIDANLLANRLLGADVGEFALTGINVDLTYSGAGGPTYTLACEAGSFTLTGIDAGLLANRRITADVGSFALTGIDAAVLANRLITAEVGAFTLTGIDAAFVVNRRLTADTGAFVLTGIGVGLNYSGATSSTSSMYYYLMMSS